MSRIHGAKSYRDLSIGQLVATICLQISFAFGTVAAFSLYLEPLPEDYVADPLAGSLFIAVLLFLLLGALVGLFGNDLLSVTFSPFRWVAQKTRALTAIFPGLITYFVRYLSWSVLLRQVMGLEGYRLAIPIIEQDPGPIIGVFNKYQNMPVAAEQRALTKRSAWIVRHLGDVSQAFSKLVITAAEITSLLRAVEDDQTLVHAAYYSDDECVAQIADWIAGKG